MINLKKHNSICLAIILLLVNLYSVAADADQKKEATDYIMNDLADKDESTALGK